MVTITLVTITLVTITLVTDLPSLFIGTEIKEPITSLVRSYQLRLKSVKKRELRRAHTHARAFSWGEVCFLMRIGRNHHLTNAHCLQWTLQTLKLLAPVVHNTWSGIWVWLIGVHRMSTQNPGFYAPVECIYHRKAQTRQFFNVSHSLKVVWIWRTVFFRTDRQTDRQTDRRWQTDMTNQFTPCAINV